MAQTLSLGSRGQDVRALQDALNYQIRRGTPLKVDGVFGSKTDARVREFQKAAGLVVDGIAGAKTQAALYETTEITLPLIFLPRLQLAPPTFGRTNTGIKPPRLIPPLQWPGPPIPAPPPFTFGSSFQLRQSSFATLPGFTTPANALGLKLAVPTRKDQFDPTVQSRIALVEMIEDLPVNAKFKAFLVSQIPSTVTKISPPSSGFNWGAAPLFDPFNPTGFGLKGNARFTIRVTQGGDGRPNIVVGAWGDGKLFLDFTNQAGKTTPRVQAEGQIFIGASGTF
jgi:peptidoglycan hydrolase-like protein with peptidoglycan-binding domain